MTEVDALLERAEAILTPWAVEFSRPEAGRLDAVLDPRSLLAAVGALQAARFGYFAALTGLDHPAGEGGPEASGRVEGLYHFCEGAAVLTLRVSLPYDAAEVESLCALIPSASLYEREFSEMFGVTVLHAPSTERLLLADDWPEGVYPMRKSFQGEPGEANVG